MADDIAPQIADYLKPLERAVDEIANTWRPDDPNYRADLYRQIMMQLSYSYFAFFHADPEHPDWAPLWNPVYTLQPNPDDIYLYCPISSDYRYRITGIRNTVKMITIGTQGPLPGMLKGSRQSSDGDLYSDIDDGDLQIDANGKFEVLLSATRPEGFKGDWLQIKPGAVTLMTRYRSYDWENEVEPVMSIECLNPVGLKKRLTPAEILDRIDHMAWMPVGAISRFFQLQNGVRERVGINMFEPAFYGGGLSRQVYLPAVYELEDDEALVIETELPKQRRYWNFQLNDPYFNATEYVYRLSSTNGHFAKISSDGRFRAVVSLEDPGVPNWLDPAGFKQGTIYGRWYDCDSHPVPTIRRIKFKQLRAHLPADTPTVTPEARAQELRSRVRACQRRRRW